MAVIADNTWAALKGREALNVRWKTNEQNEADGDDIRERMKRALADQTPDRIRDDGNVDTPLAGSDRTVSAEYELPMLAHACMEPMNFTAYVEPERCRLWGPTQVPAQMREAVAGLLGMAPAAVEVNPTLAGGGFGRRLAYDYGVEAALVSKAAGVPVQVVWTREDDMRRDYFRQPSLHSLRAGLTAEGRVVAWHHRLATASLLHHINEDAGDREIPAALFDVQGGADMPYDITNVRFDYVPIEFAQQMGSWRSVSYSFNVFAVESFLDEVAEPSGAGEPPYPSVAPAITNAIRAAGGPRVRRLPLNGYEI